NLAGCVPSGCMRAPQLPLTTTIRDLLDPLTGERRSVRFAGSQLLGPGDDADRKSGRDIDGSDWWILPALYDADANLQLLPAGLRRYDLLAALSGGIQHTNAALPGQVLRGYEVDRVAAEAAEAGLPRVTPILQVSPADDSAGFPDWLAAHRSAVAEHLAPVC